ncbi:hypothetical protein [Leptospira sp. 'Mane']|uniref:hypothetical protein n=1 Tax=Leptospira sp. 'Mane' TaxID=3387407 RepID=UPI00398BA4F8
MKETKEKLFNKDDLYSGRLADIISDRMLVYQSLREKFQKILSEKKAKLTESLLDQFQEMYGFKPGKEILEWENLRAAYSEIMYNVPDIWNMIDHHSFSSDDEDQDYEGDYKPSSIQTLLKEKDPKLNLEKILKSYSGLMFLFTGTYTFASDGGGDTCWINLFPNEKESVEVNRYNHEIGKLESDPYYSISHFIADNWSNDSQEDDYEDFEDDEEETKPKEPILLTQIKKKTIKDFETAAAKQYEKKPIYYKSLEMFERSAWLLGHSYGDPAYAFTESLADAPSYSAWESEKKILNEYTNLSAYWILAHFFMKNDHACKEACQIAKSASGKIIPLLADTVLNYLNGKSKTFNSVPSEKIEKLRDLTFRNCDPNQIEPQNRKSYDDVLGLSSLKTLSKKELETKLKEGAEPFALIIAYPEDVNSHDLLLKEAGKKDPAFAKIIEEYFRERNDSAYNEWPYKKERLDKRLSLPVSAAFRQGLKYDSENKKAFCGITRTLGKFDDDNSMSAFRDAIRKLKQDDPRLEYIVSDLIGSEHKDSLSILTEAAWKVFSTLDSVLEKKEKVAKEGPNLNNIFTVYSHLGQALQERILVADEESIKLCDKVLSYKENLGLFGISIGYAFAVSAKLGLVRHLEIIQSYLHAGVEIKGGYDRSSYLELSTLLNLSEGAMAWAFMSPDSAKQGLYELFELADKNDSPSISIDLKACLLSGLLLLEPEKKEWIDLANRILGNKGDQVRVYGVIRAVGKKKIQALKHHLVYHIYADPDPMVDYSWTYIENVARVAWNLLTGEDMAAYDSSDQYASSLSKNPGLLPEAILHPEKYSIQHVFEKIREKNFKHEDVIKYGGPWLLDSLRYSLDEYKYAGEYDRWEAVKTLYLQGRHALPYFAEVLDLPYASPSWKLHMLQLMRMMEPEAKKWEKTISLSAGEIKSILNKPSFDWIAWVDLLCVRLYLIEKENSFETILATVQKRLEISNAYTYSSYAYEETLGMRIPRFLRWFGKKGDDAIEKLWKNARPNSEIRTYLDEAAKAKVDMDIPDFSKITGNGIHLTDYIRGDNYGFHFWIYLDEAMMKFGVNEFHLQGILKDSKAESSCPIATEKKETLHEVWQMAHLLGYKLSVKKSKKK